MYIISYFFHLQDAYDGKIEHPKNFYAKYGVVPENIHWYGCPMSEGIYVSYRFCTEQEMKEFIWKFPYNGYRLKQPYKYAFFGE
jgi:hypothetical protein